MFIRIICKWIRVSEEEGAQLVLSLSILFPYAKNLHAVICSILMPQHSRHLFRWHFYVIYHASHFLCTFIYAIFHWLFSKRFPVIYFNINFHKYETFFFQFISTEFFLNWYIKCYMFIRKYANKVIASNCF